MTAATSATVIGLLRMKGELTIGSDAFSHQVISSTRNHIFSMDSSKIDTLYHSLDQERREVRLLRLAPGSYDDAIVIEMWVESVFEHTTPEYHALSYVWGTSTSPHKALVNGQALPITTNLDCALRHLRYSDKSRILWIDALSINQTDLSERSSQVQIMSNIYSFAKTVIVWLGPGNEDDEETIRSMSEPRRWDIPTTKAILRILQRPWFTRVWV
jgi:hypothetical protein